MFTVIICSRKIIDDCNRTYNAFLKPLLENGDWTFLEWNTAADSIKEANENLRKTVAKHKEWRAIIVNDIITADIDNLTRINPFDVAGSVPMVKEFKSAEQIKLFREDKEEAFAKAVNNPLAKMANWILGAADRTKPERGSEEWGLPETVEGEETVLSEIERCHARRYEVMHEYFDDAPQVFNNPTEVIAVSERILQQDESISRTKHMEFEYSRFYEDNMYPAALRYIVYDMRYVNQRMDFESYFNFLVFILTLATGQHPRDSLKPERVYIADAELDTDKISELCHRYIFKLQETKNRIDLFTQKLDAQKGQTIDNATAYRLFESDVNVPVKINVEFTQSRLMAEHSQIGLAKDCPGDEESYWDDQHREIRKLFNRYAREPQRAVKTSVLEDFRNLNYIDDNRVLRLSDAQKDNIRYRLLEEEENMVKMSFSQKNNTAKYNKRLDEANAKIKKYIGQRMTRRKTIFVSIAGTIAFALGFMPWIIDAFRLSTGSQRVTNFIIFAIGVLACLVVAFLMITSFRAKLISLFKKFNKTMDGNLLDMEKDLGIISKYLSHACNVMREFSVLNAIDSDSMKKRRALDMHTREIDERIDKIYWLFYKYIDDSLVEEHASRVGNGDAYEYDFTQSEEFEYEMPYATGYKSIEYMQPGFILDVPVDYLKAVTLRREELYD